MCRNEAKLNILKLLLLFSFYIKYKSINKPYYSLKYYTNRLYYGWVKTQNWASKCLNDLHWMVYLVLQFSLLRSWHMKLATILLGTHNNSDGTPIVSGQALPHL